MSKIYKYNTNEKATICVSNGCATVYGDAAKVLTGLVLATVSFVAIGALIKALK